LNALGLGASGLPYYCTPPVTVPAVLEGWLCGGITTTNKQVRASCVAAKHKKKCALERIVRKRQSKKQRQRKNSLPNEDYDPGTREAFTIKHPNLRNSQRRENGRNVTSFRGMASVASNMGWL